MYIVVWLEGVKPLHQRKLVDFSGTFPRISNVYNIDII